MKTPMDETREKKLARALGLEIARRRERVGMTQEALAEILEIGSEAVSRMERGVVAPSISRLYDLARLFGCALDDMLSPGVERFVNPDVHITAILSGLDPEDRDAAVEMMDLFARRLKAARSERRSRH